MIAAQSKFNISLTEKRTKISKDRRELLLQKMQQSIGEVSTISGVRKYQNIPATVPANLVIPTVPATVPAHLTIPTVSTTANAPAPNRARACDVRSAKSNYRLAFFAVLTAMVGAIAALMFHINTMVQQGMVISF